MNTATEKIQFRRIRDFGETIGVTTQFIYQNFKPLVTSIAYIALPFILLGSLTSSIASAQMYSGLKNIDSSGSINPIMNGYGLFGISYSFILIGIMLLYPTINEYVYLYATRSDYDQITPTDVRKRVLGNISTYITTFVGVSMAFLVSYFAIIIGVILIVALGASVSGELAWIFALIGLIGFGIFFGYLLIALSFSFIIRIIEKTGIMDTLSRCFTLLKGYGFVTFLLYFVTFCICTSVSGIVYLLSGVVMYLVDDLNIAFLGILVVILGVFSGLAQVVTATITSLVSIFRYFSLVELKEANGFMQRIEEIGKNYENRYANNTQTEN
jgi:hypothetical protein